MEDTQAKQRHLWKDLILRYCQHHRLFILTTNQQNPETQPLFHNISINRKLDDHAIQLFLDDLVKQGHAVWLDKARFKCLILWKKIPEWADTVYKHAVDKGLLETVATVDELVGGDDVQGGELDGLDREVLWRAVKELEKRGRARLIIDKATNELAGIKFA